MKIATFNINSMNRRLPNLLLWLKAARPDIACLQELKAADAEFPVDALRKAGYRAVWRGQKTWNGVAILARGKRTHPDTHGLAWRRRRHAKPLHRSGDRWRARRLPLPAQRQSATRPEIRLQARLVQAPARACAQSCCANRCRSCSPATTTSRRPSSTSTRPRRGTMTRSCSPPAARPIAPRQAGLDRRVARATPG